MDEAIEGFDSAFALGAAAGIDDADLAALDLAQELHAGEFRDVGEFPFIEHPLTVAELLEAKNHAQLVPAGLLHDALQYSAVDLGELRERFGVDTAAIVFAADKVANVMALREAYALLGDQVESSMPVPIDQQILLWEELLGLWCQQIAAGASIASDGGLLSDAEMIARGGPSVTVGMTEIKKRRLDLPVKCHASGCARGRSAKRHSHAVQARLPRQLQGLSERTTKAGSWRAGTPVPARMQAAGATAGTCSLHAASARPGRGSCRRGPRPAAWRA